MVPESGIWAWLSWAPVPLTRSESRYQWAAHILRFHWERVAGLLAGFQGSLAGDISSSPCGISHLGHCLHSE